MSKIKIIPIFVLIILIVLIYPNLNSKDIKKSKLYISEILASNTTIGDNEEYFDYIEIYNGYNRKINLENYYLSDSEYETDKWAFPNIEIKPKEYLIIYASGKDECDLDKRICHTNFKLSKDGETIALSDNVGNIISKVTFKEQFTDISYGYKDGKYVYFEKPTPGSINDSKEYVVNKKDKLKLEITEYITNNKSSNYDKYGNYFDWIEVYNPSNDDYNLEGVYISDDIYKLTKFRLPNVTLKSKDYLVIYFAGYKVDYEDSVYADFKLSKEDKELILSNGKEVIDKIEIVPLIENISYGKKDNKWKYFPKPTPGFENNTSSFDKIGDINGST